MKLLKSIISFVTFLLAFIAIAVSIGSALCKFTDLPKNTLIQACGYMSFFWVIALSVVVVLLFLVLRKFRIALSYIALMVLFTFLLDDFSLKFLHHRMPEKNKVYDSLNVVAYNIKYYSYGFENISKFIKESDFDVMLLSESVLTPEKLEYLRNSLPAYTVLTDNGHDLSILSKYPILNYKIVELPTYIASLSGNNDIEKLKANGVHRSFIHAVINVNGTAINVLSLRLIAGRPKDNSLGESIKWGKYLLNAQAEELAVFISYIQTLKGPLIFGGDLNVQPNTEIIHRINNYAEDTYLDEHYMGSYTFKVSFPTMRIDYLFHSKEIISKESEVMKAGTILSDHFPIRAKFLIPRQTSQAISN
ncbi:MAG: endonuclease/exonuclease/phosphatase family protein [Bacteroidales bacterium]